MQRIQVIILYTNNELFSPSAEAPDHMESNGIDDSSHTISLSNVKCYYNFRPVFPTLFLEGLQQNTFWMFPLSDLSISGLEV